MNFWYLRTYWTSKGIKFFIWTLVLTGSFIAPESRLPAPEPKLPTLDSVYVLPDHGQMPTPPQIV